MTRVCRQSISLPLAGFKGDFYLYAAGPSWLHCTCSFISFPFELSEGGDVFVTDVLKLIDCWYTVSSSVLPLSSENS